MDRLNGKIAIVTGAAQGMGASHARAMIAEGARVVLGDINRNSGMALADELGASARFVDHDVTSLESWERIVRAAGEAFGDVNVLVNNAGIVGGASIDDCSIEAYRRLIEVNQIGSFMGMKAVLASMRRAGVGSIVNISSLAGLVGSANTIGYCDTKFALRGMSKVAAIELGPDNIRVNTIHPGAILTPMALNHPEFDRYEEMARLTPLGRFGQAEEISKMVVFLASDESSFSTGAEFIADGGAVAM